MLMQDIRDTVIQKFHIIATQMHFMIGVGQVPIGLWAVWKLMQCVRHSEKAVTPV
jgi:hypothetical protein